MDDERQDWSIRWKDGLREQEEGARKETSDTVTTIQDHAQAQPINQEQGANNVEDGGGNATNSGGISQPAPSNQPDHGQQSAQQTVERDPEEQLRLWKKKYANRKWTFKLRHKPGTPIVWPRDVKTNDEIDAFTAMLVEKEETALRQKNEKALEKKKNPAARKLQQQASSKKTTMERDTSSDLNATTTGPRPSPNQSKKPAPKTGGTKRGEHTNVRIDGGVKHTRKDKITDKSSAFEIATITGEALGFVLHKDNVVKLHTAGIKPDEGVKFRVAAINALKNTERDHLEEYWWRKSARKLKIWLGMTHLEPGEENPDINEIVYGTRWIADGRVRQPTDEEERQYAAYVSREFGPFEAATGSSPTAPSLPRNETPTPNARPLSDGVNDDGVLPQGEWAESMDATVLGKRRRTQDRSESVENEKYAIISKKPNVRKRDKSHLYKQVPEDSLAWNAKFANVDECWQYIMQNITVNGNKTLRHSEYPAYFDRRGYLRINEMGTNIIEVWLAQTRDARNNPGSVSWPEDAWNIEQMKGLLAMGENKLHQVESAGLMNTKGTFRRAMPRRIVNNRSQLNGQFIKTPSGVKEFTDLGRNTLIHLALTKKLDANYQEDKKQRTDQVRSALDRNALNNLDIEIRRDRYMTSFLKHRQELEESGDVEKEQLYREIDVLKGVCDTRQACLEAMVDDEIRQRYLHEAQFSGIYVELYQPLHPLESYQAELADLKKRAEEERARKNLGPEEPVSVDLPTGRNTSQQLEQLRLNHFVEDIVQWASQFENIFKRRCDEANLSSEGSFVYEDSEIACPEDDLHEFVAQQELNEIGPLTKRDKECIEAWRKQVLERDEEDDDADAEGGVEDSCDTAMGNAEDDEPVVTDTENADLEDVDNDDEDSEGEMEKNEATMEEIEKETAEMAEKERHIRECLKEIQARRVEAMKPTPTSSPETNPGANEPDSSEAIVIEDDPQTLAQQKRMKRIFRGEIKTEPLDDDRKGGS